MTRKGRRQGSVRFNRCACVIPCLDNFWACEVRDHTFPSLPLCLLFAQAISHAGSILSSTLFFRKTLWILQNFVPLRLLKLYLLQAALSDCPPQASSFPLLLPVCAIYLAATSYITHRFPSEQRSQDSALGSGRLGANLSCEVCLLYPPRALQETDDALQKRCEQSARK